MSFGYRFAIGLAVTLCAVSAHAETRYFSLILQGKKAGYVRVQEEAYGAGVKVTSDCLIKITMLGSPFDVRYQTIATYANTHAALPTRYTLSMEAGPRKITSDSRFSAGKIEVDLSSNGVKEHKSLKIPDDCVLIEGNLPETWERAFRALGGPRREVKAQAYAPSEASITPIALRKDKQGLITADHTSIQMQFAVKAGALQRIDVPAQQATFVLGDKAALEGIEGVDAASRAFAVSNVALDNALGLNRLVLDIKATIAGEKLSTSTLNLPRQKFTGNIAGHSATGRLEITKAQYDGKGSTALPLSAAQRRQFAAYLRPDAMIESDDPEIKALARKLTKGCKTTWQAASKIGKWVHENIVYKISGVGAKQCLKEMSGDCGPHSWLSIALLRAAGIPADITGGALYSDLLGGSFGQHYWTNVWVGGKTGWFPIDTTSGEIGSLSPTHLNLWKRAGGIASLSVNVVDFSPKPKPETDASTTGTRRPLGLRVGETWTFAYMDGAKAIGREKGSVARIRPTGEAEVEYTIDLEMSGTKIKAGGTLVVRQDGSPISLSLKIEQSGLTQSVVATVDGKKLTTDIEAAGIKNKRSVDIPAGTYLEMALSALTWDILFRSVDVERDKTVDVPTYLVDSLSMQKIKLQSLGEETIRIGGKQTPCVVVKIAAGEKFYLEKGTGKLLRASPGGGKLVVDRE